MLHLRTQEASPGYPTKNTAGNSLGKSKSTCECNGPSRKDDTRDRRVTGEVVVSCIKYFEQF